MLINNWYVAGYASDIRADRPFGVRILGCDFVLFRDASGAARCLSNVCVHRGAALANGRIVDGNVECPYHGWQFGGQGRCLRIPALGDDATIPKRARIDSYPTMERYGWVWVFLGDLPEAERPQVPDLFPEYALPEQWRAIHYHGEGHVNWARFEENSLDTAHINFVHPTFGTRRAPRVQTVPITPTQYGAKVHRVRPAPKVEQKTGEMAKLLNPDRGFTSVSVEFSVIGVCHRIQPVFQEGMSIVTFSVKVPIDATHTRTFGIQARNFLLDPEHDDERRAMIYKALQEDLDVVTRIEPKLPPRSSTEELLTETDGMEFHFRQRVREWASRGFEIDVEQFEARRAREVLVIPSPERRADPSNWVHRTVPLLPAVA
ncbi:MAG: aromatic ring-hydroxylating dioxygenase subunit alpha [Steroidobacteraceae bacterium]|nr:aromatic ring-hydroxylating dioxygenase subunit alpha [Steroidobacteraceae bacterium]MDW8259124.1 aromatic ring-hydroxylating dioxygenase subunit alpha [Gammaproteobacteria bacterium]